MKLESQDIDGLKPLIVEVVRSVLAEISAPAATSELKRLAWSEKEAAELLGVARHVLRDARLRGEINSTKVGGRIHYTQRHIDSYLRDNEG